MYNSELPLDASVTKSFTLETSERNNNNKRVGRMSIDLTAQQALQLLQRTLASSLTNGFPELSTRAMAILLSIYTTAQPHTIPGLAQRLKIPVPLVSDELNLLNTYRLVRSIEEEPGRSGMLIRRTVEGSIFLHAFADHVINAAKEI